MYVEEIQKTRLADPKTPTKSLVQDHTDYHKQLGHSREEPGLSAYHDQLTERMASAVGTKKPVLSPGYQDVWDRAYEQFPDLVKGLPVAEGKGPVRSAPVDTPVLDRTPGEDEAIYRYEAGRTFDVDDQWETFKTAVAKDLQKLRQVQGAGVGVDDELLASLKQAPRGVADPIDFVDQLQRTVKLKGDAFDIASSWADEVDAARGFYSELKAGNTPERITVSPVTDMRSRLLGGGETGGLNAQAADALRETAKLYESQGEPWRAKAYQNAAEAVTRRGAPSLTELLKDGGGTLDPQDLLEAFGKNSGIGKNIAEHLAKFAETGTFDQLEALKAIKK